MPRIALAQIKPVKGDYAANLDRIGGVLQQVAAVTPRIDLVVFPETVTSGYFVEGGVRQVAVTAGTLARDLASRHKAGGGVPLDVAVGFYEVYQSRLFNSCLYATLDGDTALVRHVHRKCFLPTYGLFDEERFVDKGHDIRAFDTGFGWRAAVLICRDVWHSLSGIIARWTAPGCSSCRAPARAGDRAGRGRPHAPASMVRWERLVRGVPRSTASSVALANLVASRAARASPAARPSSTRWGTSPSAAAVRGVAAHGGPRSGHHHARPGRRADAGRSRVELPHLVRSLEHAARDRRPRKPPREGGTTTRRGKPTAPRARRLRPRAVGAWVRGR
jgi:predicted amidohydrolase